MTKRKIWTGILALMLTFGIIIVGCKNDSDDTDGDGGGSTNTGGLTITDIPAKYNGYYVLLLEGEVYPGVFDVDTIDWDTFDWTTVETFFGCKNYNPPTGMLTLPQISNGTVTIPLWVNKAFNADWGYYWELTTERFKGTGLAGTDDVHIIPDGVIYTDGIVKWGWFQEIENSVAGFELVTTLVNGNGTIRFGEGGEEYWSYWEY